MIDLERLRVFISAAEHLSFSEAASRMHVTQPPVSHHIKTLEQSLGVELFERSGNSVKLTEAGRLLLPWAHKLVRQAIEVQYMMTSMKEGTAGKYVLPQLAARFRQRYPAIQVNILACRPEEIIPQLLEAEANLAVVSSYELCGGGLECQEFFRDAITLIVPAGHAWARRELVEPAELLSQHIIMREATSGTRRVLKTELAKHDITEDNLNIFLELGNAEAIVRTVEAGYGVSFVSNLAAEWARDLGRIATVPVAGLQLRRVIYMVRRELNTPHRAQEVFWNFVHSPANEDLLRLPRAT